MNKKAISEWRQFLKEDPTPQEISDEVIQLIFSDEISIPIVVLLLVLGALFFTLLQSRA